MLELYSTPLNILFLALTIIVVLLGLFLIIAIYHVIKILSNINKVSSKAKDTIDLVNHYLWQPIKIAMMLIERSKAAAHKATSHKAKKNTTTK